MTLRLDLKLPEQKPVRVVVTDQLQRASRLIVNAIPMGGVVACTGHSHVGKSTLAKWVKGRINAQYDADPANPRHYRASYYQTGEVRESSRNQQRLAVRGFYGVAVGAPLTEGGNRRFTTNEIAEQAVKGLIKSGTRLVFVDEAGTLSADALNGLVLIRDVAESSGWPTAIVLIGMDDLAAKLDSRPQFRSRVHEWIVFEEYGFDQVKKFLEAFHPHFSGGVSDDEARVIWEHAGGFPGRISKFLRQVDARLAGTGGAIDVNLLRDIALGLNKDHARSRELEKTGYAVSVRARVAAG